MATLRPVFIWPGYDVLTFELQSSLLGLIDCSVNRNLMDKRLSPRYAISLNALVHPDEGRSWLCAIRDFCTGGMLLVEQEYGRHEMPPIEQGVTVGIHFSVPGEEDDQHFRLEGRIVRVMDSGVGINFPEGMSDEAMTALLDFTNLYPMDDLGEDPEDDEADGVEDDVGGEVAEDGVAADAAPVAPVRSRGGAGLATSAKRPRRGKSLDLTTSVPVCPPTAISGTCRSTILPRVTVSAAKFPSLSSLAELTVV